MKFLLIVLISLNSICLNAQLWSEIDSFPALARDDGTSFIIGNKAYCGTGIVPFYTLRDFYSFHLDSLKWAAEPSLPPGKQRQYASGFSYNSKGFVFGGVNDFEFLNDLWEYDPLNKSWSEKDSLPSAPRAGATSFVIDSVVYIIGGKNSNTEALSEVWSFNMSTEVWLQKNDIPFGTRWRAAGASNDSLGYLAFGLDSSKRYHAEIFEYSPKNDSWRLIYSFPEGARNYTKLHCIGNQLISIGGMDSTAKFLNECWSLNLLDLSLENLDTIPSDGIRGGMSFSNQNSIFYASGLESNFVRTNKSWRLESATFLKEIKKEDFVKIYSNPFNQYLHFEITKTGIINPSYCILDINGRVKICDKINSSTIHIDLSYLSRGLYYLLIESDNALSSRKVIKL